MKHNIVKILIIMIILIMVAGNNFVSGESSGNKLPNTDLFVPPVADLKSGGRTQEMISKVLGVLELLSQIAIVVAIAIIGFNSILGSASEKAEWNQKLIGVVIAAVVLVAASKVAQLVINIAEMAETI